MEFVGQGSVEEFSGLLKGESSRCSAIVAAAFFDETLGRLLSDSKNRSFHRRIELSLEFGLLTKDEHADLHAIRSIRNDFAHDLRKVDFDPDIESRVDAMRLLTSALDAIPGRLKLLPTPKDRFLYVAGVIAFRLQRRTKPAEKTGALPEPELWDTRAWPPLIAE
jgi:hypothetical protein